MSLSYMLSASGKRGQVQAPIISVSTTRSMLQHRLAELHASKTDQLSLQTALPIVQDLLTIGAGYLASQPDAERVGLEEEQLHFFSMSARVEARVDESAVTDFARVFNSMLELTANHIELSELRDALPTIRAVLAQAAALFFAKAPLLNPSLALFVCQDIDTQITAGSPMQAVVMVGFLRDKILSAGCAFEDERVDLNRDPGARYSDPDDNQQLGTAGSAKAEPFEPVIRNLSALTPDELTRPVVPVEGDAALLNALVTQHAVLSSRPETEMLDLLRAVAAIRMKQQDLDLAHEFNITVRRHNLRLVD